MSEDQDWTLVREYKTRRDWVQLRRYPQDKWCVIWGDYSRFAECWRFTLYPCATEAEAWAKYEDEAAEARKWASGPRCATPEECLLAYLEAAHDAKEKV